MLAPAYPFSAGTSLAANAAEPCGGGLANTSEPCGSSLAELEERIAAEEARICERARTLENIDEGSDVFGGDIADRAHWVEHFGAHVHII